MAILTKEASKLTLGQDLQIIAPHAVEALLRSPPEHWISHTRIVQYQVLLLDPPRIQFLKTTALNPAMLLPDDDLAEPVHNCLEVLDSHLRADLKDTPWPDPDSDLYTDWNSFMADGTRYAGAAVVTHDKVLWAQALGHRTSAQRVELVALTQALRWGKDDCEHLYRQQVRFCYCACAWGSLSGAGTPHVRRQRN